ncbi:MAG: radical SAM family heme chaperone HemW [Clostridia bacterium]|nr:radical SAM family heme chaperone HemW [Clostridia bacterium]
MNNSLGVYIHIPFCSSRCKYCDFVSSTGGEDAMREYVAALKGEIQARATDYVNYTVDTLFIGGGTPSALYVGGVEEIILHLRRSFNCDFTEATVECNPESLTENKLDEYISSGVTRLSIGVQSLSDNTLSALGRRHTAPMARQAVSLAVESGLDVSCDIMLATPYQSPHSAARDAEELSDMGVSHISAYMLSLEQGTPLAREYSCGKYSYDDDCAADIYQAVADKLHEKGFDRYEVSNWAKEGKECLHNLKYWKRLPYLGLGAAAHSLIGNTRFYNSHSIEEYLEGARDSSYPVIAEAVLTDKEEEEELIMLSLRTSSGLDTSQMGKEGRRYIERARRNPRYFNTHGDKIVVKDEFIPVLSQVTLLLMD